MASLGFLVSNVTYLFISFVHPLLLKFLGCWVEFALAHLATATSVVALALTVRLEAFFVMVVIAGILRACFFAVPFALAKDVVQAMSKAAGTGTDQLGLSMSLVSASIPLAYCTIFPWIGPLEDLTGNAAVPLWLGAGFCCLSVISFLCVGKP